jgi:hypothetical protein
MSTTKQIPRDEWESYFERFTRQHLGERHRDAVTIEVVSPQVGDQFEATTVPLLGVSYDPKSLAFEVLTEDVEHLVFYPSEIWVLEEEGGFLPTIALFRADGTKELLYVHRSGLPAPRYDAWPPPA